MFTKCFLSLNVVSCFVKCFKSILLLRNFGHCILLLIVSRPLSTLWLWLPSQLAALVTMQPIRFWRTCVNTVTSWYSRPLWYVLFSLLCVYFLLLLLWPGWQAPKRGKTGIRERRAREERGATVSLPSRPIHGLLIQRIPHFHSTPSSFSFVLRCERWWIRLVGRPTMINTCLYRKHQFTQFSSSQHHSTGWPNVSNISQQSSNRVAKHVQQSTSSIQKCRTMLNSFCHLEGRSLLHVQQTCIRQCWTMSNPFGRCLTMYLQELSPHSAWVWVIAVVFIGQWGTHPCSHSVAWVVARGTGRSLKAVLQWRERERDVFCVRTTASDDGKRTTDTQRDIV